MDEATGLFGLAVPDALKHWSGWIQLRGAGSNKQLPAEPGFYLVRLVADAQELVYIGQTGRSLRGRLGQLNVAYRPDMPFNDPHTAAPALWALLHRDHRDFEASVTAVPGTTPHRMGLEAVAITLYRVRLGRSPLANFGGMPAGYRKSTGNNARLVAAGRRARGGPDPAAAVRSASVPVNGDLGTGARLATSSSAPTLRWATDQFDGHYRPPRMSRPAVGALMSADQAQLDDLVDHRKAGEHRPCLPRRRQAHHQGQARGLCGHP